MGCEYQHDSPVGDEGREDLGDGVHNDLEAFDAANDLDETQNTKHQQHIQRQATLLL